MSKSRTQQACSAHERLVVADQYAWQGALSPAVLCLGPSALINRWLMLEGHADRMVIAARYLPNERASELILAHTT